MNSRAFSYIAFCLAAASSCPSATAQEWARKMFSDLSHDFGIVAQGTDPVYRFEFQNIYKEDVHVASVTSSCGCTQPSIEQQDLKTWEKSAIVAKLNTRGFRDQRQATLTVRIDRPFPAEVQLVVRAFIRTDVTFEPGFIHFGEVAQSSKSQQVIHVLHHGNIGWKITDVRTMFDKEQIKVALNEVLRGNNQVNYDMVVELQDNIPPGYIQGELYVVANEGESIRYPISFDGRVVPALQLSPEVWTIPSIAPGQTVSKEVYLKARTPFRITKIESSDPRLTITANDQPNRLQVLTVQYVAGPDPGPHQCQATIETDIGNATFKTNATIEQAKEQ